MATLHDSLILAILVLAGFIIGMLLTLDQQAGGFMMRKNECSDIRSS